ncbi:putative glycosyl transferase [Hyphomonas neptunium ATCC 15444]|uniref:Putative glycosyl transferase n=2 Tax=Hyphomonas TaxID=85 RepID=Q0C2Y0_HYPNA|nr:MULTISPECIES: putative glycosyltransferase [Hyphomonas]ABI75645.1 putative glycosyl transferase [Hyphomonas neptunium ATCC 15444]KCZ95852.1 putative glycosyl transferase [Hyphomonas hirschiana VP5]
MTRIAFFGHDAADAAVRRRVRSFQGDGFQVTGFMMRRREPLAQEWENVDLGQTQDGAFLQRIRQVFRGARIAAASGDRLRSADVIYARNLDMLACAFLAKRHAKLATPVIYECLDIHRLLCRTDIIGKGLRALEGWLLKRSKALVVSSPAFLSQHFERYYPGVANAYLVENRLAGQFDYGARQSPAKGQVDGHIRLGWVGNLRCRRSLDLLCALADQFGPRIEVKLHGVPALTEIPDFESKIAARNNMSYHGRYRSPEDLPEIYAGLDVVWSGDFMEAGLNSTWLLPNRIYEGGYYCVPPIAPAGTETARWIARHECGFLPGEPLEQTLPDLIERLLRDASPIAANGRALEALPEETFVQPVGFLRQIIESIVKPRVAS